MKQIFGFCSLFLKSTNKRKQKQKRKKKNTTAGFGPTQKTPLCIPSVLDDPGDFRDKTDY